MYLVQLLVPLKDNRGRKFPKAMFSEIEGELTHAFGGVASYARAPASGIWKTRSRLASDDIIIMEIMTDTFNKRWLQRYKMKLQNAFRQQDLVVRAQKIIRL